jgi:hypothetical protein
VSAFGALFFGNAVASFRANRLPAGPAAIHAVARRLSWRDPSQSRDDADEEDQDATKITQSVIHSE